MILRSGKSLLEVLVLHLALWPCVFGSVGKMEETSEDWIQNVRKLQVGQFMQVCNEVMMPAEKMRYNSYLMSDFASDVENFCSRFSTKRSMCPNGGFRSLQFGFQDAFFRHAAQHTGRPTTSFPLQAIITMGDTGYIVSDKTKSELDVMKNDLCVQMQTAFGDSIQLPTPSPTDRRTKRPSSSPTAGPTFPPSAIPTASPTSSPTRVRTPRPTATSRPLDLTGVDKAPEKQKDSKPSFPTYDEDDSLSVGAIIGIATAVAIFLAFFFYCEARRRKLVRQVGFSSASRSSTSNQKESRDLDTIEEAAPSSASKKQSTSKKASSKRSSKSKTRTFEEIREAIHNADWDNVYRLASQLADDDDAYTVSKRDIPKDTRIRSHLSPEDQERTKTLDELMDKGDWTGMAVTAALYAGESGSEHERQVVKQVSPLQKKKIQYFDSEDEWNKVNVLALEKKGSSPTGEIVEVDIEQGNVSTNTLVKGLSDALNAGDWAQVSYYANRIKDEKGHSGDSSFIPDGPDTQAMIALSQVKSADTTDTDVSRKQTIEKLMRAEKWKGVSIMANLYDMETKQSKSSLVAASMPGKSKTSRTKELRHSDRVGDNLTGIRQEDDADAMVVPYFGLS